MPIEKKRFIQFAGAALAIFVPAIVVAQFAGNEELDAARLNQTANNGCRISVVSGDGCGAGVTCNANCAPGLVVMGGGCRIDQAAIGIRTSTPRFQSGAFPDPDSFQANLIGGGNVTDLGGGAPSGANPTWNGWACEANTGGTVQTAYAICCPFVQ